VHLILRLRGGGGPREEWEHSIAPGGLIKQCILEDHYDASIWERERMICFNVQVLNSSFFRQVTGVEPPKTPVTAKTYADQGLPFFKIYNESSTIKGDFDRIKSVKAIDKVKAQSKAGAKASHADIMDEDDEIDKDDEDDLEDEDNKESEAEYPEPSCKSAIILLNSNGAKMGFRSVSELEKELSSMNSVQF